MKTSIPTAHVTSGAGSTSTPGISWRMNDAKRLGVAKKRMEHTVPIILQFNESFDIGSDTLTGVDGRDYQVPFPLTAKLNKLTIKIDRPQLLEKDIRELEKKMREKD